MNTQDEAGAPLARRIDSHGEFVAALHEVLELALQRNAHRMVWADADFADWPLDDARLLQQLTDWLRQPKRQLILLSRDFDDVGRRCPRFVACYRLWSHAIASFSPVEADTGSLPCLVLADGVALAQLVDPVQRRGWLATDPAQLRQWRDRVDAILQRSAPAFPVTTLGL